MTELKYAADASIAFTFKLVGDALCVAKDAVVNTFESIWGYVTDTLGDIIKVKGVKSLLGSCSLTIVIAYCVRP